MRFFSILHLAVGVVCLFDLAHLTAGRSNERTASSSVFSDNKTRPSAAAAAAAAAGFDNLLLGRKPTPTSPMDQSVMMIAKFNGILHGGGRGGTAAAAKKTVVAPVQKQQPQRRRYYKKHIVWGTPTMPAFLYPILDAAFIVAYPCVAFFLLSGPARVVHATIALGHIPLAMLTNYYSCTSSKRYKKSYHILFPNWPVIPLQVMYLFDASWCVFASLSPFFLDYPNKVFDVIFHVIGVAAFCLLGFMDPQPSSSSFE
jgi:hypothetical protein